jgi:hypothetical protein
MNIRSRYAAAMAAGVLCVGLSGCILIRTTEHRITLRSDGSGEAVLRLIDIRSDETVDSLAQRDFRILMSSFDQEATNDFEDNGRKVTSKKLFTRNDTLFAEVGYTFTGLGGIEGLHVTNNELYLVVNESREVVRTNGRVEAWQENAQRIVWDRNALRLMFQIRERTLPPSTSLARLYEQSR